MAVTDFSGEHDIRRLSLKVTDFAKSVNQDLDGLRVKTSSVRINPSTLYLETVGTRLIFEPVKINFRFSLGVGVAAPSAKLHVAGENDVSGTFRLDTCSSALGSDNSRINLVRSRGVQTSKNAVLAADQLGGVSALAYDGGSDREVAKINLDCDAIGGVNNISGKITFHTRPDGAFGAIQLRCTMPKQGGFVVGSAALALNATDGFIYVPSCAGVPTGVPTAQGAATIPLVYDTVNLKLMARTGGAWVQV